MSRSTNSNPGHQILVYGVTGSGKSTAAQLIAARTRLPLTLADELTWAPDWVPVAEDEQRRLFAAVAAQDRWVLDAFLSVERSLGCCDDRKNPRMPLRDDVDCRPR